MVVKNIMLMSGGDLIAYDADGSKTYLVNEGVGIWRAKDYGGTITPPPGPTPVGSGVVVTAAMVDAARGVGGNPESSMITTSQGIANMINEAMVRCGYAFTDKKQAACFVGECCQETDWFKTWHEYGKGAGSAYAPYYGRGMIQLTWRENYQGFGNWCFEKGMVTNPNQFVDNPDSVATNDWAAVAGVYYFTAKYWNGRNLMQVCSESSSPWYDVSAAINYGNPDDGYVGPSYNLRAQIIDATLAVTPEPIVIQPPAGDVQQRLVNWCIERTGKYGYSQDLTMRMQPDVYGVTDCSALMWYCYQQVAGVEIGTWTGGQQNYGQVVINVGQPIDESKMNLGDLVFFDWVGAWTSNFDHVEMYIGNGKTIGHGGDPYYGPVEKSLSGQVGSSNQVRVRRYV